MSIWKKYGYLWLTGLFFVVSIVVQWLTHDGPTSQFINAVAENWQSEFLQLMWQVGGLMILYAWGSSQSREEVKRQDDIITQTLREVRELRAELTSERNMRREAEQFQRLGDLPPRKSRGKPDPFSGR